MAGDLRSLLRLDVRLASLTGADKLEPTVVFPADSNERSSIVPFGARYVRPRKRVWLPVGRRILEKNELVERWRCELKEPTLGFGGLLHGVPVPFPVCIVFPVAFVADTEGRLIHTDDRNADWMSAPVLEMLDLLAKVAGHSVDLLDHGFREYLSFGTNLNCRYATSGDDETLQSERRFPRNSLAEGPISPSSANSVLAVAGLYNTLP